MALDVIECLFATGRQGRYLRELAAKSPMTGAWRREEKKSEILPE